MTRSQRSKLVAAHADLILGGDFAIEEYAVHFETQMHRSMVRKVLDNSHLHFARAGALLFGLEHSRDHVIPPVPHQQGQGAVYPGGRPSRLRLPHRGLDHELISKARLPLTCANPGSPATRSMSGNIKLCHFPPLSR